MALVFVYGTLKRGFPNHDDWMKGAQFVTPALTAQRYPLVIAGPWRSVQMLSESSGGQRVSGEVFEMSDVQLEAIDRLERVGAADGYDRIEIGVICKLDGMHRDVWSYVKPRARIAGQLAELPGVYDLDPLYVHPSRRAGIAAAPVEPS